MNVKISVIIPVYNAELYLHRCIDSILKQTYQNFEVILINDGSKDNSRAICNEYVSRNKNIRVIHKENSGASSARNIGIQEANGKYILFVDADDYISEEMLQKLISCAERYQSEMVLCEYSIVEKNSIVPVKLNFGACYRSNQEIKRELLSSYYGPYRVGIYCLWNKLFKKDIISKYKIQFDIGLKRGEDAWFVFQYLKYCKRVDFIAKPYYFYYQNEESIMHKIYENQYEKWVDMRKRLINENKELKFEIDYSLFYKDFLYKVSMYCRELSKQNKYEQIEKIISDSFYQDAILFSEKLPIHIRILNYFVKHRNIKAVLILYKIWVKKRER